MLTYKLLYQSLTSGKHFTRVSHSLYDLQAVERQLNMEGRWLVELYLVVPLDNGIERLEKV